MKKNKTAQPISIEYNPYLTDEKGLNMAAASVTLVVHGNCLSKVYKGTNIENLNPPIAWGGIFLSVNYCAENNTTEVKYKFDPSSCVLPYRFQSKLFAKIMQRRINRQKFRDFKIGLKKANENIK